MRKVGQKAPNFSLPDQDGITHTQDEYKGGWLLIYFYPKDDTPGCTKESCQLRDTFPSFEKLNAKVIGVSADTVQSHKKFADKYKLPFTLLADTDKELIGAYGVWQEKKFMGRTYFGIVRSSFLISPEGKIAKIYEKVIPEKHAEQVLADLASFA
ncbi:MAG: thioredoxin-dependent thiol peroxidase [Patescibacteria group bacterium]